MNKSNFIAGLTLAALQITLPAQANIAPNPAPTPAAAPGTITAQQQACVARNLPAGQQTAAIAYNEQPRRMLVHAVTGSQQEFLYQQEGPVSLLIRKDTRRGLSVTSEIDLPADDARKGKEASLSDPANHVSFTAMTPQSREQLRRLADCLLPKAQP